jgi:hypothetical protein
MKIRRHAAVSTPKPTRDANQALISERGKLTQETRRPASPHPLSERGMAMLSLGCKPRSSRGCGRRCRTVWCSPSSGGDLITKGQASKRRWLGLLPGVPDVIAVGPGCIVFMEIKTAKGVVSAEQRSFGEQAQTLGHPWFVIRSMDDARQALQTVGITFNDSTSHPRRENSRDDGLVFNPKQAARPGRV